MSRKINIAIDGYSSCGKSTLAKNLAEQLNYVYIDSGAMYRAITLYAIEHGFFTNQKLNLEEFLQHLPEINVGFHYDAENNKAVTTLNGKNVENSIRNMEVSRLVSTVSKISEVRRQLVKLQQDLGKSKGVVMDGRDIGSVVFPDAELKLFVTAKADVRAKRRLLELKEKGQHGNYIEVLENLNHRDYEDTHRALDPLIQAEDALLLDNTLMSREEQLKYCLELVHQKIDITVD